ncbi:sigma-70 family RNA polymerase sigma factor [bacterium]|nr:sigma-70 family RNA polymerase sigma factor [bacterium]
MKLTVEQKKLVEEHLNLVPYIIEKYISRNNNWDMQYEDLIQEGNLALCKAASKYNNTVKFNTFAEIVIKNELLKYCNKSNRRIKTVDLPTGIVVEELFVDPEEISDTFFNSENIRSIRKIKSEYSGVVLKGIEAIELKMQGLAGVDIAKIYDVKPNHISAWIAKAKHELMINETFIKEISCNF